MKKISLRQRALNYLHNNGGWLNGGELERLALSVGYKASNVSRRLRELHEEGLLDRREIHGSVEYRYKPQEKTITRTTIVEKDGKRYAQLTEETILV